MACHLSGITTAVATCGTAFGSDHVKIIRRIVADDESNKAEIIFTFDGDAAGRKAAMKAFTEDQSFVASTFVAVEPHGLDPCDLRIQQGEDGVKQLIAGRTPLFEFVIRSTIADFDLSTAEGRVNAMRAVSPILAGIKDSVLRPEYIRMVAGWIGIDDATIRAEVSKGAGKLSTTPPSTANVAPIDRGVAAVERTALKCILQAPSLVDRWYSSFEPSVFTVPAAMAVYEACERAGNPLEAKSSAEWVQAVINAAENDEVKTQVRALAVEPLPVEHAGERYVQAVLARVLEMSAARRVNELKAELQRSEIDGNIERQTEILGDLMALEEYRREMREYAIGDE
jgi:DNA primase